MYRIKSGIFFFLCILCISGYSQTKYYVSTLAGDTANIYLGPGSNAGYRNGLASYAQFNSPTGIAIDNTGRFVYVADTYNNVIRKIDVLFNNVTTLAGDTADIKKGLDSNIGYVNASSPFAAKFSNPWGVCVDKAGNVYVADTYNNVIRKISTTGQVTTYAGKDSAGITFNGYLDGAGSIAEFSSPLSLAIDTAGNIYVTDYGNNAVRKISPSQYVSTISGAGADLIGYVNGTPNVAEFNGLYGIALQNSSFIFVSQFTSGYNGVRRIENDTVNPMVTTYADWDAYGVDTSMYFVPSGYRNGKAVSVGTRADTIVLFNSPTGVAFDTSGNLLVADEYNNVIRIVNAKDSIVSTLAGNDSLSIPGYVNGPDSVAEFVNPMGVAADKNGTFYVADLGNNVIRRISTVNVASVPSVKKPLYMLSIYPNPCSGRLNIISSFNGSASLLDVTGRAIWTNNDFKSPYILSTEGISPGIYFLRITSPSITEVKKVEIIK